MDLPDPHGLAREFWAMVNDPKKASASILTREDVRVEEVNGDHILVITVPRASRFDRPVYVDGDPLRGAYRRDGEGDRRCTGEELEAMRRDASLVTEDMRLLKKADLSVFSPESLATFRRRMDELRPGHPWTALPDEALLEKTLAAARDKDGALRPTAGGLLMLGRHKDILRRYPRFSLRYEDRFGTLASGTEAENVFDFYFRVTERLTAGPVARDPEVCRALREALGGCLVNADYAGRRSVEIRRRPGSVTMTGPGEYKPDPERAVTGGPVPRNGVLMRLFLLAGVGESAGSGIPGLFRLWKARGWGEPAVLTDTATGAVTLALPLGPHRARGSWRKDAERTALRKAARKESILQHLTDRASATSEELSALLGIRRAGAETILRELAGAGLVSVREIDGEKTWRLKA